MHCFEDRISPEVVWRFCLRFDVGSCGEEAAIVVTRRTIIDAASFAPLAAALPLAVGFPLPTVAGLHVKTIVAVL